MMTSSMSCFDHNLMILSLLSEGKIFVFMEVFLKATKM